MTADASQQVVEKDLQYICSILEKELQVLSRKRVLITGGAGFLGYYLVQTIAYWNHNSDGAKAIQLMVCDNFIRGVPQWLTDLAKDKVISLIQHDVINLVPQEWGEFEFIIHAASIASPTYYRKYPIETMDANVQGLRNLLDHCCRPGRQKNVLEGFLFFSSSEIYGDPSSDHIPTSEDYRGYVSCTGPRACYDESKRYGETLCVNFTHRYQLPITMVRPFNNYGPGLKITDRRVIPDFARDVLSNTNITLLSDGSATRTFCYVADAVIGYYKVLVNGRSGEAYNIGVEKPEISMSELAEYMVSLARDVLKYQGCVVKKMSEDKKYLEDNPYRRCPSIDKARREIGYDPTVSLEEGLRRTLIWYQGNSYSAEA